jgi:hypothetical protein
MIDKIYLCDVNLIATPTSIHLLVMATAWNGSMGVASLLGILGLRFADERCLFPRMHACSCIHLASACMCVRASMDRTGLLAVADAHARADATAMDHITCSPPVAST